MVTLTDATRCDSYRQIEVIRTYGLSPASLHHSYSIRTTTFTPYHSYYIPPLLFHLYSAPSPTLLLLLISFSIQIPLLFEPLLFHSYHSYSIPNPLLLFLLHPYHAYYPYPTPTLLPSISLLSIYLPPCTARESSRKYPSSATSTNLSMYSTLGPSGPCDVRITAAVSSTSSGPTNSSLSTVPM